MTVGCAKINVAEETPIPDGEMPVNLTVEGQQVSTRSYVSGLENKISSIKMLCFNGNGQFIAARDADLTPTGDFAGKLTGHVPENTSRIHFVANFGANLDLSGFGLGSLERLMMKSEALSSGINDEVRFWGFHSAENPAAMASWLLSNDTVHLLRDRARVTVINNDPDIQSVQWTITNGLNRGFVAATSATGNLPYTNGYVNQTLITEYRSKGIYTLTESTAGWVSAGEENPQYLFENSNSSVPVKLIIKATYTDGSTRYHTILLQDDNKVPYQVFRNASFKLTINNLPSESEAASMGSGSFDDAVTTENYSNNPYAQVSREVDEISNNEFKLTVEKVVKMFHARDANGNGVVNFTYTALGSASTSELDETNFEVIWEGKGDTDTTPDMATIESAPTVMYDPETGAGTVTFKMNEVTEDLKSNSMQIVAKNSGLSRFVDLYSITSFAFGATPTLSKTTSKRTSGGIERDVYKLDFKLNDSYPDGLYPVKVRFYSSSLVPFSDNKNDAVNPHGSFTMVVGRTEGLTQSTSPTAWNYKAQSWGCWYEYVIDTPSEDKTYTIYLNEILDNMTIKPSLVGLYFEVENYSNPNNPNTPYIPLTQSRKQVTVTGSVNMSLLDFNSREASQPVRGGTVKFTNSSRNGENVTLGYRDLTWGGWDYYNGKVEVTPPAGASVTSIVITYSSNARYSRGTGYSVSAGSYTVSGSTGTWTGNSSSAVTLTIGHDGNNWPITTGVQVTYVW